MDIWKGVLISTGAMWLLITLLVIMLCSFFILDLKIVKQQLILDHNALNKRGKIFCITYFETKSFKTELTKFRRKFNLTIILWKAKFIVGYRNFKPQGQKMQDLLTMWLWWDSIGRSPKKSLQRHWSFTRIVSKNLKEGFSAVPRRNPNQA